MTVSVACAYGWLFAAIIVSKQINAMAMAMAMAMPMAYGYAYAIAIAIAIAMAMPRAWAGISICTPSLLNFPKI